MSTETISVIWEEPAPAVGGAHVNAPDWVPALIANPNKWARVEKFDNAGRAGGAAQALKSRSRRWVRDQGSTWDAASRRVDGEYWLFACYLGQAETPAGGQ